MKRVAEVIVVEGKYDKNTLSQIVEASIVTLDGFAAFHDREKLAFLRRLAEKRGLIILTDSDGAGFVLRNFLKGALPPDRVKHAYIPEISGKEIRRGGNAARNSAGSAETCGGYVLRGTPGGRFRHRTGFPGKRSRWQGEFAGKSP